MKCKHCGESLSKVYQKKNGHHFNMLNCLLEEITDLVTMATSTWTSHTNYGIVDILLCHVCKGIHHHTNQNEPPGKNRNAIQYISPAIIIYHISPNPMAVPKPFKYHLKRTQTRFGKTLVKIKIFTFEIAKVKVH